MWIDITQELFSSEVYPGDTPPAIRRVSTVEKDGCMVTDLTMCAHNGTHIDAPAHFLAGGMTVDKIDLSLCAGICEVCTFSGVLTAEDAEKVTAKRMKPYTNLSFRRVWFCSKGSPCRAWRTGPTNCLLFL